MTTPAGGTARRDGGRRPRHVPVRPGEWGFPLLVAAILLAVAWIPYGTAYRTAPESERFMGLVGRDGIDDNNVYLGLMRQAAEGRLLFANNFTPEPNRPALFNAMYLVLGRVAGVTGWSLDAVHRLFGAASIVLLVLTVYAFIATAIRKPWYRRMALVLACFAVGLTWLFRVLFRLTGVRIGTVDAWLVEASVFHTMLVYPHFVFAAALMTGSFLLLLRAERQRSIRPALTGGLCAALLAASHAFEVVVLIPAAVAYVLFDWLGRERVPGRHRWLALAAVTGLPLPVLYLNHWILEREPMWGNVVARLDFFTPDPFRLALGLGATFFIALLTFEGFLRTDRADGERLARAWLLLSLALAYLPQFNWRFHLLNGIQIPLAVLATQGLRRTLFRALLRRRRPRAATPRRAAPWPAALRGRPAVVAATGAILIVCCLSGVNLVLSYRHEVGRVEWPTYLPGPEVAALEWMGREIPRDALVLASYATGNYIPRLAGQRVFLGEDKLTEDAGGREADVLRFFGSEASDRERLDLLRRFGVDYVYHGRAERRLGGWDPAHAPFLAAVHEADGVRIFRVDGRGIGEGRARDEGRVASGAPAAGGGMR